MNQVATLPAAAHFRRIRDAIKLLSPSVRNLPMISLSAIETEMQTLREALFPRPEIKGTAPLILYFGNDQEREEFVAAVNEAKPGMKSYKV